VFGLVLGAAAQSWPRKFWILRETWRRAAPGGLAGPGVGSRPGGHHRDRGPRTRARPVPCSGMRERHGYGVEGNVDGHIVRLGKAAWIIDGAAPGWVRRARLRVVECLGQPHILFAVPE